MSEKVTPYNQHLAWKYREFKRAELIHSSQSFMDIVKLRHTVNERPISIDHDDRIATLYSDFVFKQRHSFKDREQHYIDMII